MLEVGCGDGALTRELLDRGYAMTAIDPEPPDGEPFVRSTLEDFEAQEPFDAAVAIRSLHHLHDLDRGVASLTAALAPGGRLVMFEFAAEHHDQAARAWAESAGIAHEHEHEMDLHDVIALAGVRAALAARFTELVAEPAPYLAREADREDLVEREREAIAGGELEPLGMRLVYELRT